MKKSIHFLIIFMLSIFFAYGENYSLFRLNGKYGIISDDRAIKMQPVYDYITLSTDYIICSKDRIVELYNPSFELLYSDSRIGISKYADKEMMINDAGNLKIFNLETGNITKYKSDYGQEYGYRENLELVIERNKRNALYSVVDDKGNVLITDIEQAHTVYTNGMLAVIMEDGKSGFINNKGQFVFEADFYINPDDIGPRKYPIIRYMFKENYALVMNNEKKWVQYDKKGKMKYLPDNLVPQDICYEEGLIPVKNTKTDKVGYMNPKFKIVIPYNFDEAFEFIGQYAIVKYAGRDAVIDKKGNVYFCEELR